MAQAIIDLVANFTNCLFCFPSNPQLKINSRSFRMLRLLGEGGFSYVYLVQDTSDSSLYALKKIRCPFGQESVALALKEVEAYSLFQDTPGGEYVISSVDHQVKDEGGKVSGIGNIDGGRGGGNKTVYILLPYYRRGNLQDAINANLVNHTRFGERRLLKLMLGVCRGLKAMHHYRIPQGGAASNSAREARAIRQEAADADADASRKAARQQKQKRGGTSADQEHQETLASEQEQPLMPDSSHMGEITAAQAGHKPGTVRSYAHRDIKPGNIMVDDDDNTPVLMDLGSMAPSPTPITSRSIALAIQDQAAEHSTMPYRAPELFDVKTGSVIDTKVDIWSLGCTMYACLVGKSPFEARSDETGGSLSICVLGGDWRWPGEGASANKGKSKVGDPTAATAQPERLYPSEPVREVVRRCLQVEPTERPDVDALISLLEACMDQVPADEEGVDV